MYSVYIYIMCTFLKMYIKSKENANMNAQQREPESQGARVPCGALSAGAGLLALLEGLVQAGLEPGGGLEGGGVRLGVGGEAQHGVQPRRARSPGREEARVELAGAEQAGGALDGGVVAQGASDRRELARRAFDRRVRLRGHGGGHDGGVGGGGGRQGEGLKEVVLVLVLVLVPTRRYRGQRRWMHVFGKDDNDVTTTTTTTNNVGRTS